jgi:YD repeat-containing protein
MSSSASARVRSRSSRSSKERSRPCSVQQHLVGVDWLWRRRSASGIMLRRVTTNVYNDDRLTTTEFSGTGATGTVVRVDFAYDNRDDQTGITWFSDLGGTTTIAHSAYAYDNADRLTSITNTNSSNTVLSASRPTWPARATRTSSPEK